MTCKRYFVLMAFLSIQMMVNSWTTLPILSCRIPTSWSLLHQGKGMEDFESTHQAFDDLDVMNQVKPLTAALKRIKKVELQLLEGLETSDESIDPIVDLWTCEREDAAPILRAMEEQCSPGLKREEDELRRMINYYGNEWTEPMARLALILFTRGQYDESKRWCNKVLLVKPWHFEVGKLLVALQLRQDEFSQALITARKYTLPSLNSRTNNKRRKAWVEQVSAKAQEMFSKAEQAAQVLVQDEQIEECPIVEGNELCWG